MAGESQYCQTCNELKGTEYDLRLDTREGGHNDIDIRLCEVCADSLRGLDWIESVSD